jgi:oxazoline/thiazoline dehydrogenase
MAAGMIALEPESDALAQWQFHNLLFHRQTRLQRLDDSRKSEIPRFEDHERSGFVKQPMSDACGGLRQRVIALEKPDLIAIAQTDISLTQAIESRQSIREYDDQPITLKQLGEFLFRCARVKEVYTPEPDLMNVRETTKRPYPSGGALYELEIYPVINRCQGLDAGLYHYQPLSHSLHAIADWHPEVEALIFDAWKSTGQQDIPQVLLIVTARFGRLFWKYYGIGYGLILKHIGVLYQTFYLVATAMQLAPTAIGSGNSEQFNKVAQLNEHEESSVGEFMLGSLKN